MYKKSQNGKGNKLYQIWLKASRNSWLLCKDIQIKNVKTNEAIKKAQEVHFKLVLCYRPVSNRWCVNADQI